jgi:glycosyltransferase involved in cell wall biosynthesis
MADTAGMHPACSILFFDGYLGVSPTVLNLSHVLSEDGYAVTVYATRNPFPAPRDIGENSKVTYFRRLADLPGGSLAKRALERTRLGWLVSVIELGLYAVQSTSAHSTRRGGVGSSGGFGIGIDANGVITAWLIRLLSHTPYACLSLEIGPSRAFSSVASIVRLLERRAYRGAAVVIVQDEERFQALTSYMRYRHPHVELLPNSPLKSSSRAMNIPSEDFLRQRCAIPIETFPEIILQAGMIDDAVFSEELARSFATIDDGCALVYHERQQRDLADPYLVRLLEINPVNLFLSLDPVPMEDLDRVYASATVGVAFYKTLDPNFSLISSASGKLGYYLKHAKPVIVHGSPSLGRFVEERDIGIVVCDATSPGEIKDALGQIRRDYARYSRNARAVYEAEFDFERTAQSALSALRAMCPMDGSSRGRPGPRASTRS